MGTRTASGDRKVYRVKSAPFGNPFRAKEAPLPGARKAARAKGRRSLANSVALAVSAALFAGSSFLFAMELIPQIVAHKEISDIRSFKIEAAQGFLPENRAYAKRDLPSFEALSAINKEIVGWIYLDGAEIDHPLVQGSDNDYYLSHTFKKTENDAGSIFMDFRNANAMTDQNTVIYGHKMKNGAMFGKLLNYRSQEEYEKSPVASIYTVDGKAYHYQIFASAVLEESYDYRSPDDGGDFEGFIEKLCSRSEIQSSAKVKKGDRILTMSTCTPPSVMENGRFAVFAVLLNKGGNDIDLSLVKP
ncbi:MAG: class B sortase [Eubacteriaceae bacterium]|nr:class B sortase [Eubacteriaceae bacterium]